MTENRATGHEQFGAGLDDIRHSLKIDPAIYFNPKIEFTFGAHAGERGNFVQGIGDELLAPETGIHAHYQDVMDKIEDFGQRFDRSGGIEHDPRLAAV